ncbi:hypothetical protein VSDG_00602 [Cytospora chrysosperma]|uniref:Uncharacterized protein n=1 Tax=Cytospora chrysosperma TaxID=252740 RepID=A0A423WPW1_CYTCH|nr:hypothetical protein VSDG_00602 [Valsa sordida]
MALVDFAAPTSGVFDDLTRPVLPYPLPELKALGDLLCWGTQRNHNAESTGILDGLCGTLAQICSNHLKH